MTTEVKYLQIEIQTVTSKKNLLNISTNTSVGNNLRKDVHYFTQQLQGIATNIQALTSHVETVELHAVEKVDSNFTGIYKDQVDKLDFEIYNPCGPFPKLKQDFSLISNKLESGGGINCNGNYLSHEKEASQWFKYHKATIFIFLDATCTKEAAKKIDLDYDLESSIRASFSTNVPSILVGNSREAIGGAFECIIGNQKYYTVWNPRGTKE